ncbi:hypothetical protein CAL18_03930 [Bordetella genomosp. 7]|uniref:hypothetical protein n=1 Tax=Bordetella genomosp. 7 TaxID=1416805 RepID=UPI000B9DE1B6|nr:hypothetical protein [Bordetella genomosp. 7]OZI27756.1 hypothetical protein CAL18_03930 [Bordetella genomosp. 7]
MAVVYVEFERARRGKARVAPNAVNQAVPRRDSGRAVFWGCLGLAPLAGLAAPVWAVPQFGHLAGWGLAGAGLLACVLMLFGLARLEADRARDAGQ